MITFEEIAGVLAGLVIERDAARKRVAELEAYVERLRAEVATAEAEARQATAQVNGAARR